METISDLTNQPILVSLSNKQHKFRQLTIAELFGRFEAEVKNDWTARVHDLAKGCKTSEDQVRFLAYSAAHPLSSEEIVGLVREKLGSASGINLLLSMSHILEGVDDLLPSGTELLASPEDQATIRVLLSRLTGTDSQEKSAAGPKPR